ncbi:MAG: TIGR03013 family PEP-CTERM/XrtA system glycosyltransferase [Chromatiaceae bacterium]|jgi:sugar transferase (PEP-CTERM system associated)|nr:TIGR03013 family PEP-CTERM/XrtA system glycosyltransferase [Chromatiaceae bacterium]
MIRLFGYYVSKIYLYLGLVELVVFFAAFNLGARVRFGWELSGEVNGAAVTATALVFAPAMSVALMAMGLYQRGLRTGEAGFLVRLALACLFGTALLTVVFYFFPAVFIGRGVVGWSLVFAFTAVLLVRSAFGRVAGSELRKRRVLVLGAGENARHIEDLALADPGVGFHIAGFIPLPGSPRRVSEDRLVALDAPLVELAIAREVDEIVVAADDRRGKLPVHDLLDCKMSGFEVLDLLTFFEKELALVKIDLLHPSWIFFSPGFHMGVTGLYGKRLFDLAASLVVLALGAPILALVTLASLIESRGRDPIFYTQVRVGENGKPFLLRKFRSMRPDAEADGVARWASENDTRITRLGAFLRKTRLDELPQVFNVLRGEMSLVGPRPERPEFVSLLAAKIPYYSERHRVKPGVTGWAQLLYPYGSGEEDARRKLEYDLYYVKHAGIVLDLIILLQTVEVVLFGKGAR